MPFTAHQITHADVIALSVAYAFVAVVIMWFITDMWDHRPSNWQTVDIIDGIKYEQHLKNPKKRRWSIVSPRLVLQKDWITNKTDVLTKEGQS